MMQRSSISARLAQKFKNDYKAVMKHYKIEEQIELTKYLMNIIAFYLNGEETDKVKLSSINNELEALKKKYGKNFKAFRNGRLHEYFDFNTVLCDKEIYTDKEYNNLEEQGLTEKERSAFLNYCSNGLRHRLDDYYLECEPEETAPLNGTKETGNKKGKIERTANDKRTRLSHDQTIGLMGLLQEEKVLLKDENLSDTDAGIAINKLTGYSTETSRIKMSNYKKYLTKENLMKIDSLLSLLRIRISNALKAK